MSLEFDDVTVYHGNAQRHRHAHVTVIADPPAMFVWDQWATTVYTNIVNLGQSRFVGYDHDGKRYVLKIGTPGGCGCGWNQ